MGSLAKEGERVETRACTVVGLFRYYQEWKEATFLGTDPEDAEAYLIKHDDGPREKILKSRTGKHLTLRRRFSADSTPKDRIARGIARAERIARAEEKVAAEKAAEEKAKPDVKDAKIDALQRKIELQNAQHAKQMAEMQAKAAQFQAMMEAMIRATRM